MCDKNREQQASHFDIAPPFVPGADILRQTGFRYQYVLKDVLISKAFDNLQIAKGTRVLDVGSGAGVLLDRLGTAYKTSNFGVDVSHKSLLRGIEKSPVGLNAALSDARKLPFGDNTIDLAVSLDVLEHIKFPDQVISEIVRVLRPGGDFICYAVSKKNKFTFNWFLAAALDRLKIDHWAWSCHHPDLLVDPGDVHQHLIASGCTVESYEPFHAFFTILLDQVLMVLYRIGEQIGIFHQSGNARRDFARGLLRFSSYFCRKVIGTLQKWDTLWISRELSNGFLIVARKQSTGLPRVYLPEQSIEHADANRYLASGIQPEGDRRIRVSNAQKLGLESADPSTNYGLRSFERQDRGG